MSVENLVSSGPLILAIPVAAAAGALTFLSPCCLPLVPGYLSYITGMSGVGARGPWTAAPGVGERLGGGFGRQLVYRSRVRHLTELDRPAVNQRCPAGQRRLARHGAQAGHGLEHLGAGHREMVQFGRVTGARELACDPDDRNSLARFPPTVHCSPVTGIDYECLIFVTARRLSGGRGPPGACVHAPPPTA